MPHFFTICNGGYDFWVCRYTSSSLTTWKFTEVRIHTHAHNFIWLLCFSNCKSLGPDYLRLFLIISRKYVGNNDSHSDPFGAKPMNASALLQRSSLMHIRPSKVQIKKKTCVSRLSAHLSSNITNVLIDTTDNSRIYVMMYIGWGSYIYSSCGLWELFLEPSGYIFNRHCRIILLYSRCLWASFI